MILYIETNSLIGGAKGQDINFEKIFEISAGALRIAIPDVCIMEAWSVFEFEARKRHEFSNQLDHHLNEAKRDLSSSHALSLVTHLERAKIDNLNLISDIKQRLSKIIDRLAGAPLRRRGELIAPTPRAINMSINAPTLIMDPTDNLILATILAHARRNTPERKVLLTSNTRDFETRAVRAALDAAGIERYFSRSDAFLGWFGSLPESA